VLVSEVDEIPRIPVHDVSIVIPVYRGEHTLPALLEEIVPLHQEFSSPAGTTVRTTPRA
jgi:polyisoprenyl-phosphate glycosyltransferase